MYIVANANTHRGQVFDGITEMMYEGERAKAAIFTAMQIEGDKFWHGPSNTLYLIED